MDLQELFKNSLNQTESAAKQLAEIFNHRSNICTNIGMAAGTGLGLASLNDANRVGKGRVNPKLTLAVAAGGFVVGFLSVTIACELAYSKIASYIDEATAQFSSVIGEYGHSLSLDKKRELEVACADILRLYNREANQRFQEALAKGYAV